MTQYDGGFYENQIDGSRRSANVIVPLLMQWFAPSRVVDVGCGLGTWLRVFAEKGVDVCGIDGGWVEPDRLQIDAQQFVAKDISVPFTLPQRWDLVLCLEVAEHLHADCAARLVDSLVQLGDVVVFSAAIPSQGGTYHVNEQWPEYWAELFAHRGYAILDCVRKRVWHNTDVQWWYAQNMLVFVDRGYLAAHATLKELHQSAAPSGLTLVHPDCYLSRVRSCESLLREQDSGFLDALGQLPRLFVRALRRRLGGYYLKDSG